MSCFQCELLNSKPNEPSYHLQFSRLEVKNSSFFSSESYETYNATGSTVASRYITTLTIPEDVKQAKVTVSDLQVYAMVKGSWISGLLASKNIKIR